MENCDLFEWRLIGQVECVECVGLRGKCVVMSEMSGGAITPFLSSTAFHRRERSFHSFIMLYAILTNVLETFVFNFPTDWRSLSSPPLHHQPTNTQNSVQLLTMEQWNFDMRAHKPTLNWKKICYYLCTNKYLKIYSEESFWMIS